ncbi:MAG TPA: hypothetical protein VFC44_13205 [Candidatus Saccharimonadales bacterium]|nr:hypothetical protein [Candidatus Saccharimonadales bacterium]
MKVLLLIGALLGFAVGFLFSWAEESSGSTCLWHACLAAYLTSLLMRWWGGAWRKGLEEALRERHTLPAKVNKS